MYQGATPSTNPQSDLARRLEDLARLGDVFEVNHAARLCRVKIGNIETNWLRFQAFRAGRVRTWSPPSLSEQVLIISPGGDLANGIVLTGINDDDTPAPSSDPNVEMIDFPDGAAFSYNHNTGALLITGIKSATINSPITTINGDVAINGTLTQQGGPMVSNGITVHTHTHGEVLKGGAHTGVPA